MENENSWSIDIKAGAAETAAGALFMSRLEQRLGSGSIFDLNGIAVHVAAAAVRRICKQTRCPRNAGIMLFNQALREALMTMELRENSSED